MAEKNTSRISISVPSELLRRFDETIERIGYSSRSKAMQDAMHNLITESKWLCKKMGNGIGAIAFVYDHEVKDLDAEITEIEHKYKDIIKASLHIHLSERDCMEITAVNGSASEIRDLAQELKTKRGVKQLKVAIVTP